MGIGIAIGVVLAIVGFVVGRGAGRSAGAAEGRTEGLEAGRAEGRKEAESQLQAVVEAVSRGRRPAGVQPGSAVAGLQRALEAGWAPKEEERHLALREAISRVGAFLDKAVRTPLSGASADAPSAELYERIQRALGALQDLDFFIAEPTLTAEGRDLPPLVQQVTREFAQDQAVGVRIALDGRPVKAKINPAAFMDALYLVLHNAARFGGGSTVDLTVVAEKGTAFVRVRDRGKGFTEEAFQRAFDPFYSTTDDGLGLGLPHARRIIEGMGGKIQLRNVPDGGGEVEIAFPAA